MKQNGVVTKLLDPGYAEVAVERGTACGHCSGCGECVYGKRILVRAKNTVFAKPGERIVLESETGVITRTALMVYMIPVALLFIGYAVGAALGLAQDMCIAASGVGVAIGAFIVVIIGNRQKKIDFRITGYRN